MTPLQPGFVVIKARSTNAGESKIVVGVDGSDPSVAALRQAQQLCLGLGCRLEAVHVWSYPPRTSPEAMSADPEYEEDAEDRLDVVLTDAFGANRPSWLAPQVLYGHPAEVLIDRSADAEMLVLGSRGHGGFHGLRLGSVGAQCVAHALCPVLIVR